MARARNNSLTPETLDLMGSRSFLKKLGVPLDRAGLARTVEEARNLARRMGYPVVLKVVSPQIIHKTDVGGVRVNILNDRELASAFRDMMQRVKKAAPEARIKGVLVEEMVRGGIELIIGSSLDPQFGRMIMLGLGGVFVEVFKDVVFRLVPITRVDAQEMISELKGRALLEGIRGTTPVNTTRLAEILLKVSKGLERHHEISELDINPLIATDAGFKAVDARIVLK